MHERVCKGRGRKPACLPRHSGRGEPRGKEKGVGRQVEAAEVAVGSVLGWREARARATLLGCRAGTEARCGLRPPVQARPLGGLAGPSWLQITAPVVQGNQGKEGVGSQRVGWAPHRVRRCP